MTVSVQMTLFKSVDQADCTSLVSVLTSSSSACIFSSQCCWYSFKISSYFCEMSCSICCMPSWIVLFFQFSHSSFILCCDYSLCLRSFYRWEMVLDSWLICYLKCRFYDFYWLNSFQYCYLPSFQPQFNLYFYCSSLESLQCWSCSSEQRCFSICSSFYICSTDCLSWSSWSLMLLFQCSTPSLKDQYSCSLLWQIDSSAASSSIFSSFSISQRLAVPLACSKRSIVSAAPLASLSKLETIMMRSSISLRLVLTSRSNPLTVCLNSKFCLSIVSASCLWARSLSIILFQRYLLESSMVSSWSCRFLMLERLMRLISSSSSVLAFISQFQRMSTPPQFLS